MLGFQASHIVVEAEINLAAVASPDQADEVDDDDKIVVKVVTNFRACCGLCCSRYCLFHVCVQTNFRQYYFYFLPDQAQILLYHFNVLDKL